MFAKDSRIYVAGHRGLVGGALCRELAAQGYGDVITAGREEVDLLDAEATERFLLKAHPTHVFLAAAKVGGIRANSTYPAEFIRENLQIVCNLIHLSWKTGVTKLLFLGSSCIYPKMCPQPIREEYLLTGPLEETNEPYAIAKIAGIVMCQSYRRQYGFDAISVMPTNLYGLGDTFNEDNGHVLPSLLLRFANAASAGASSVTIWGTGTSRREFLYVDDLAKACLLCMRSYSDGAPINIGCGSDITILELAKLIADVVGFKGEILLDRTKPDGTPRKMLDVSRITDLGWKPEVELRDGIQRVYASMLRDGIIKPA